MFSRPVFFLSLISFLFAQSIFRYRLLEGLNGTLIFNFAPQGMAVGDVLLFTYQSESPLQLRINASDLQKNSFGDFEVIWNEGVVTDETLMKVELFDRFGLLVMSSDVRPTPSCNFDLENGVLSSSCEYNVDFLSGEYLELRYKGRVAKQVRLLESFDEWLRIPWNTVRMSEKEAIEVFVFHPHIEAPFYFFFPRSL